MTLEWAGLGCRSPEGAPDPAWEVKKGFLEEETSDLRYRVRMKKSWESVPGRRNSMYSSFEARKFRN